MDRRITRSLASQVKKSDVQNVQLEASTSVLDNGKGKKARKGSSVSKYHYEIDMWGRKKRVPNRDHSSKQAEVENMIVTSPDHVHQSGCAQGEEVTSKQRTRTSSTSSPRKRKASQSTTNNVQAKMDGGVTGSGRQSSSNAHQRNSCSHAQAKVNSNSISQPDGQVVVKKEKSERNHCLKQQSEQQQQVVPKSSSRSSTNRNNQVVSKFEPSSCLE